MYKTGPNAPFKPPRLLRPNSNGDSSMDPNQLGFSNRSNSQQNFAESDESSEPGEPCQSSESSQSSQSSQPKRRIISNVSSRRAYNNPIKKSKVESRSSQSNGTPVSCPSTSSSMSVKYYLVQWRKKTTKKNKTWDGDGLIIVTDTSIIFKNSNNKILGKILKPKNDFRNSIISIGTYELEIDCETTTKDFKDIAEEDKLAKLPSVTQFKNPSNYKPSVKKRSPLYSIGANSLIMKRPNNLADDQIVDVVVDPQLSSKLRPHQRDGVKFLYECLMGFRNFNGNGALLADEMGLGKTLMTITLIWTLYKQSPFSNDNSSIVKKVLICCPVTLIDNWKKEFKKWLGLNKISVLTLNSKQPSTKDKQDIINFGKFKVHQVLIMSYEKILNCSNELMTVDFDLLVCDEGHKLKNSSNKVLKILNNLNINKKILLTGTPIQNDLNEFFTIINFINPGIFGSFQSFQKKFVRPILLSREINCNNPEIKRLGKAMSNELINLTKDFILRRTNSILSNYLTSKTDIVLFVPPTDLQIKLFKFIMNSRKFDLLINENNNNQSLSLITLFKKVCNSPSLLSTDKLFKSLIEESNEQEINLSSLSKKFASGKINVLIPLLLEITNNNEKIVLISNYTQTLNLLEIILKKLNLSFLRLDGSTPNNLRNKLVTEFNDNLSISVFLLSSKSGGMGINLIGASRLIMFDNDWNPSTDLQSMARIHRDGQMNPVFIYRILTTGCIDEKIFQRQLMKNTLSKNFLDNDSESNSNVFDFDDLKNLFEIIENTDCNTHDLLECECEGKGEKLAIKKIEELSDSDEEEEKPPSGWISALDIKNNNESLITKNKMSVKNTLDDYKHFNLNINESIQFDDDKIVDNVIHNSNEKLISFLMCKFTDSTIESLEEHINEEVLNEAN